MRNYNEENKNYKKQNYSLRRHPIGILSSMGRTCSWYIWNSTSRLIEYEYNHSNKNEIKAKHLIYIVQKGYHCEQHNRMSQFSNFERSAEDTFAL